MTAQTDLCFTNIKLNLKFCLTILRVYGSGCCGNSDGVTICSFGVIIGRINTRCLNILGGKTKIRNQSKIPVNNPPSTHHHLGPRLQKE
jgi:hypothetical protein